MESNAVVYGSIKSPIPKEEGTKMPCSGKGGQYWVFSTEHYKIECQCKEKSAAFQYARILECAYLEYKAFFGCVPPEKERLVVKMSDSYEECNEVIICDGRKGGLLGGRSSGGFYWPTSKVCYLYTQPTLLFTRTLLLHECAHQFHYLAVTNNCDPGPAWYREGIAEAVAEHYWDPEHCILKLNVRPLVTLKDLPQQALKEALENAKKIDTGAGQPLKGNEVVVAGQEANESLYYELLEVFTGKRKISRAFGCYLIKFLINEAQIDEHFRLWCRAMESDLPKLECCKLNELVEKDYLPYFGDYDTSICTRFIGWLETQQQPFREIYLQWQTVAADSLRGVAASTKMSLCELKRPVRALSAMFINKKSSFPAGFLLYFNNDNDYSIAMVYADGFMVLQHNTKQGWKTHKRINVLPGLDQEGSVDVINMRVERDENWKITLYFGTSKLGPWDCPPNVKFGFSICGSDVIFRNIGIEY